MFTGLVEECAKVCSITKHNKDTKNYVRLRIEVKKIAPRFGNNCIKIGDSIAVNGVCLTVVKKNSLFSRRSWFEVEVLQVSLEKTSLGNLENGSFVNVERALRASDRLGGHFVTGHVTTTGRIISFEKKDENYFLVVSVPSEYIKYMVDEGSVTLNGISLTIAKRDSVHKTITCNIIPHTKNVTNLKYAQADDIINIESDVLIKYLDTLIAHNK